MLEFRTCGARGDLQHPCFAVRFLSRARRPSNGTPFASQFYGTGARYFGVRARFQVFNGAIVLDFAADIPFRCQHRVWRRGLRDALPPLPPSLVCAFLCSLRLFPAVRRQNREFICFNILSDEHGSG